MRASEITQAGHYWYRAADEDWDVVFFDGRVVDQISAMISLPISEFPGEFVGPLTQPSDEPALCDCPCHNNREPDHQGRLRQGSGGATGCAWVRSECADAEKREWVLTW